VRHSPAGTPACHVRLRPTRGCADLRALPRSGRLRRTTALAVTVAGTLLLTAGPAVAHDALLGSEPPDGAVVAEAPDELVLTFAAPQSEIGTEVVVTGPDGASWSDGAAVVSGSAVTQPLRPGMVGGVYSVQWRSVAADGHPVSGTLAFTVDPPVAPAPAVTATASPEPSAPATAAAAPTTGPDTAVLAVDEEPGGGFDAWAWIVAGAGALLVLGYLVFASARKRGAVDE